MKFSQFKASTVNASIPPPRGISPMTTTALLITTALMLNLSTPAFAASIVYKVNISGTSGPDILSVTGYVTFDTALNDITSSALYLRHNGDTTLTFPPDTAITTNKGIAWDYFATPDALFFHPLPTANGSLSFQSDPTKTPAGYLSYFNNNDPPAPVYDTREVVWGDGVKSESLVRRSPDSIPFDMLIGTAITPEPATCTLMLTAIAVAGGYSRMGKRRIKKHTV